LKKQKITPNTVTLIIQCAKPFVDNGLIDQDEFKAVLKLLQSSGQQKTQTDKVEVHLVSRHKAAELLSVSLKTVDRLAGEKKLNRIKIGNLTRFRYKELAKIMNSKSPEVRSNKVLPANFQKLCYKTS
jgi:excisionase family DNA binding protein